MSAVTFDTELHAALPLPTTDVAAAAAHPTQRLGLFAWIIDAVSRACTVELPNGEIIIVYPPC